MASASNPEPDDEMDNKNKKGNVGLMSRMEINDNKAGMEGLDKEKINQIIFDASKGSKFYENERKKEEQLDLKIEKLKSYASQISPQKMHEGEVQADLLLDKLKFERDVSHTIVHVDMDAFYAAVEMKDDPTLKSKPMAVGGLGMLSTSNYLARKFGVRAAMPGFIGLKLCPSLVIVKENFDKYRSVSHEVRKILALYDPNFCPMSLDEAYLDFGQHLDYRTTSLVSERTFILRQTNESKCKETIHGQSRDSIDECLCELNSVLLPSVLNSDVFLSLISDEKEFQSYVDNFDAKLESGEIPSLCTACKKIFPKFRLKVYGLSIEDAVLEMRNRIEQHTQLTASAGIAPNMMLAKICSDKNKPNGQCRIMPDIQQIESFIEDLPIRKVSGIGKVTEKLLGGLDVTKCSDIYSKRSLLYHLFSPTSFHHFLRISLGMGSTTVERDDERKSISTERTFSEISDVAVLCSKCEEMSIAVADDLKQENMKGKTVTLKIKTVSFEVKTRSQTLQDYTNDASIIFNSAKKLLLTEITNSQSAPLRLRLMGVRMSKLTSQTSEPVTVDSMFDKYKGKETVSIQHQSQISDYNSSHRLDGDLSVQQDEDEEDFSLPVTDQATPVQCEIACARNVRRDAVSPSKPKKEAKKGETSSGSILNFFTRHRDIKVEQSESCACGPSDKHVLNKQETNPKARNSLHSVDKLDEDCDIRLMESCGRTTHDLRTLNDDVALTSPQGNSRDLNPCSERLTCPICGKTESDWDLLRLNCHIDTCLSHRTIRDILHDEKTEPQGSKRLRPCESNTQQAKHPGKVRKVQSSVLSYFQL